MFKQYSLWGFFLSTSVCGKIPSPANEDYFNFHICHLLHSIGVRMLHRIKHHRHPDLNRDNEKYFLKFSYAFVLVRRMQDNLILKGLVTMCQMELNLNAYFFFHLRRPLLNLFLTEAQTTMSKHQVFYRRLVQEKSSFSLLWFLGNLWCTEPFKHWIFIKCILF